MREKEKFAFQETDETNTDLLIYGEIRKMDLWDMFFGDDPTRVDAFSFKEALDKVKTPNLTVRINSMGGSVSEGLAIYNMLTEFKGNLISIVDGFACSAASIIFMAAKKRIVPESGLLMIHNAQFGSGVFGDSNALKKAAEDLEKITQPSINIYTSKTKLEEKEIKEKMDRETWITSQEALEWGFATTIERDEAKQSVSDRYVYSLIMKLKELENNQKNVVEPHVENIVAEPLKPKSSWDGFFV